MSVSSFSSVARTLSGMPFGYIRARPRPGQIFEMLLCRLAVRHRLVGVVVADLIERKFDAPGEADRLCNCVGRIAEQRRHFARGFQMPLGIGFEKTTGFVERPVLADAGDDVLQWAPLGRMIEHVVGGQECDARFARDLPRACAGAAGRRRDRASTPPATRDQVRRSDNFFSTFFKFVIPAEAGAQAFDG